MSGTRESAALATAANLACAVDCRDRTEIERILHPLTRDQLYALAVVLAAHVDVDAPLEPKYGPDHLCELAAKRAAEAMDVDVDDVMSPNRNADVVAARAVAMASLRRAGLTTVTIGRHFGRDHTTVVYATEKVARTPRLRFAADRVSEALGIESEAA